MKRYSRKYTNQHFQFTCKRLHLRFFSLPRPYNLWWTIRESNDKGMKPFGNPGVSFKMTSPSNRQQSDPILKPGCRASSNTSQVWIFGARPSFWSQAKMGKRVPLRLNCGKSTRQMRSILREFLVVTVSKKFHLNFGIWLQKTKT